MKKISVFLLGFAAIFCMQFALFAEFPNNLCPSIPGNDSKSDHLEVAYLYPGAQLWFDVMVKKYPQAHLDKMRFRASDDYESGPGMIYFPHDRLQEMHKVFAPSYPAEIFFYPTDAMFAKFAEDEYLLLHEATHVLCKDVQHGDVAINVAMGTVIALSVLLCCKSSKNEISLSTQAAGSVLGACLAYVALCAYARFQESRADNFANQNADKQALHAGANWFKRLNTLMNFENISVPEIFNSISKVLQDPTHPAPEKRAQKALAALTARFGQTA
jgi:hypothetical protein